MYVCVSVCVCVRVCVRACMCVSIETGLGQSIHPGQGVQVTWITHWVKS